MKAVYIAHPISGDIKKNCERVKTIVSEIIRTRPDVIPIVPYLTTLELLDDNDPKERDKGMEINHFYIKYVIDELWCFGPYISSGMQIEIEWAARYNKKVVYSP